MSDSPDVALHAKSRPRPSSTYWLIPGNAAPRALKFGAWMSSSIRISGEKYDTCGPITATGWPLADLSAVTPSQLLMPSGMANPTDDIRSWNAPSGPFVRTPPAPDAPAEPPP